MAYSVNKSVTKLNDLTATKIVAAIKGCITTCKAVRSDCLERIESREASVQAWQYLNPEHALRQAIALDKSGRRGPLVGVPFGIKDIIDTADMPTGYGPPIAKKNKPKHETARGGRGGKHGGGPLGTGPGAASSWEAERAPATSTTCASCSGSVRRTRRRRRLAPTGGPPRRPPTAKSPSWNRPGCAPCPSAPACFCCARPNPSS